MPTAAVVGGEGGGDARDRRVDFTCGGPRVPFHAFVFNVFLAPCFRVL